MSIEKGAVQSAGRWFGTPPTTSPGQVLLPPECQLELIPLNKLSCADQRELNGNFMRLKKKTDDYSVVTESIKECGFINPLITVEGVILVGNMRYLVALGLGYSEIPCYVLSPYRHIVARDLFNSYVKTNADIGMKDIFRFSIVGVLNHPWLIGKKMVIRLKGPSGLSFSRVKKIFSPNEDEIINLAEW